ncbi:NUDIX domain-containing protein [Candidatus Kuenenbacteria bacterium]|nr:NUDIX domain-containing protein [Candidatus Kuenenbacteria bacterium]
MPHIHEKIDFCAETFIVYKNKVLLRKHDKLKIWLSVGGHIELDEDPNQGAVREVLEEVGLEVELYCEKERPTIAKDNYQSLICPQHLVRHNMTETHEHIVFVYYAKANSDELTLCKTEVTDGCKWFTKEEITKNDFGIAEDVRLYALEALDKLAE